MKYAKKIVHVVQLSLLPALVVSHAAVTLTVGKPGQHRGCVQSYV